jgi:hypothetical protein
MKQKTPKKQAHESFGGDEGIRTLDLCVANAPLSHLSYIPMKTYSNRPSRFFNSIFSPLSQNPAIP